MGSEASSSGRALLPLQFSHWRLASVRTRRFLRLSMPFYLSPFLLVIPRSWFYLMTQPAREHRSKTHREPDNGNGSLTPHINTFAITISRFTTSWRFAVARAG